MRLRVGLLLVLLPSMVVVQVIVTSAAQPALIFQKTWSNGINDQGSGVAVDSSGNIYVTGWTTSSTSRGVLLLKFSSAGNLVWQRTWTGGSDGYGSSVAVDSAGNVYVAGCSTNASSTSCSNNYYVGSGDVLLLKFDSAGNLVWRKTWGGDAPGFGDGVAVDPSNNSNIYVAGEGGHRPWGGSVLLKFDSSGRLIWQKSWPGAAASVAVDLSGKIYLTGSPGQFPELLKFDSSGSLTWQKIIYGNGTASNGVAVDPSNNSNIYVAGQAYLTTPSGIGVAYGVLLLKFDSSGSLFWQKIWHGTGDDTSNAVAVDSLGNVYVTGITGGPAFSRVLLLKFTSAGNLVWQKNWGSSKDGGLGVAVDSYENAAVTGYVSEAGPYTLGSINGTISTLPFNIGDPNYSVVNPNYTLNTPTGTVRVPSGNQSYGGRDDVFLFKFGAGDQGAVFGLPPLGLYVLSGGVIIIALMALFMFRRRGGSLLPKREPLRLKARCNL